MNDTVLTDEELLRMLAQDVPCGDITTGVAGIGRQAGRLAFRARHSMTVCATEEAARLFSLAGAEVEICENSGRRVAQDALLLQAAGSVQALHRVWKTAQVLVEWASGISSAAAAIVSAASPVAVACTRKNVPGSKAMSVKAVRAGGAVMHRLGLSESLLLFAEHRLYLDETPADTVARFRRSEPEKKLAVEVSSVEEALRWALAGAQVLQLEKFTPGAVSEVRAALIRQRLHPVLAAAGGIRAGNAADYMRAGADLLVTSAPYTAPPCDVQVTFYKP